MTANPIPFIAKGNSISVFLNGKMTAVDSSHPNFNKVVQALKDRKWSSVESLINIPAAVAKFTRGAVKIVHGVVYYGEEALHNTLTTRILEMSNQGFSFDHMLKFLENLYSNPSKNSVEQLFNFLDNKNLPITEDGHFLAYKAVRKDYFDKYSGTILNKIGTLIEMPRNKVCDDYKQHCQSGLHCGAMAYVKDYGNVSAGDRILIVKVNPADAVSVPDDHNFQKLRVSKYFVHSEMENPEKVLTDAVVITNKDYVDPTDTESDDYRIGAEDGYRDAETGNYYPDTAETVDYQKGYEVGYDDYVGEENVGPVHAIVSPDNKGYAPAFIQFIGTWLDKNFDQFEKDHNGDFPTLGDLRDQTLYTNTHSKELERLIEEYTADEDLDFVYSEIYNNQFSV
jgi:hypothetical protein